MEGVSRDVYVFEEDRQQWVKSNHPMPTGLTGLLALTHNTSLVVCGLSGESSPPSTFVYNSQSSQWHSKAPPPLHFHTAFSSAVVVNGTYYITLGVEGTATSDIKPLSPAVFSQPLSTLLDSDSPPAWQRMPDTPYYSPRLATTGGYFIVLGGLTRPYNLKENNAAVASNLSSAIHAYCPATSSWVKIGDLYTRSTSCICYYYESCSLQEGPPPMINRMICSLIQKFSLCTHLAVYLYSL